MYSGKAGLQKKKKMEAQKAQKGRELVLQKTETLKKIFSEFQNNIGSFTEKYRNEINTNPQFRDKFNIMCQ